MKKYIAVILSIIVIASVFVACSSKDTEEKQSDKTTASETTTGITTDAATIKDNDAINLIQSYSAKELGLTKEEKEECSFMVSSYGEQIKEQNKDYYIKVIAVIKTPHEDSETKELTYTFDYKGEYYIRYDGKQILSKNLETNEYTEMTVKAVPTTEPTTVPPQHADKN